MEGLEDYEIGGIAVFRYIEPRFQKVSDENIIRLYSKWSNENYAASWASVDNKMTEEFCKWAYSAPVDQIKEKD